MSLSDDQIDRYSRQIILPELGGIGQAKLLAARILIAGDASLTSWAARYLGAAGIGALDLVRADPAFLDELRALNPDCRAAIGSGAGTAAVAILDPGSAGAPEILREAWQADVPVLLVAGDANGGWLAALSHPHPTSACPDCAAAGSSAARAATPALLATLAATEAIKIVLGVGLSPFGRRLIYDRTGESLRQELSSCGPACERWRG